MRKATLTILTVLTFGSTMPKMQTTFTGAVKIETDNQNDIWGLYIEFRIDTLVIARNVIQPDGTFEISAMADREFDVYYRGIGIGDTYVQTIKPTDKDTVPLTFKIPNNYKKHFGKTICPKCNKHDQTVPIRYGDESAVSVDGVPYDTKNYYAGTCITSDLGPRFFCRNDKIKF